MSKLTVAKNRMDGYACDDGSVYLVYSKNMIKDFQSNG